MTGTDSSILRCAILCLKAPDDQDEYEALVEEVDTTLENQALIYEIYGETRPPGVTVAEPRLFRALWILICFPKSRDAWPDESSKPYMEEDNGRARNATTALQQTYSQKGILHYYSWKDMTGEDLVEVLNRVLN